MLEARLADEQRPQLGRSEQACTVFGSGGGARGQQLVDESQEVAVAVSGQPGDGVRLTVRTSSVMTHVGNERVP